MVPGGRTRWGMRAVPSHFHFDEQHPFRHFSVSDVVLSASHPAFTRGAPSNLDHLRVLPPSGHGPVLARLLPDLVDIQPLEQYPDIEDWAIAAYRRVGSVTSSACTSVMAYRHLSGSRAVKIVAFQEYFQNRLIIVRGGVRLNDPEYPIVWEDYLLQKLRLEAAGIYVDVIPERPEPVWY